MGCSFQLLKDWCVVCCLEGNSQQFGKRAPQVTATDRAVVSRLQRPPGLQEAEACLRWHVSVDSLLIRWEARWNGNIRGRNYTVAMCSVPRSLKCSFLEGNCSLTLNGPLGPGATFDQLELPVLMGSHPECQKAKAAGTDESYISKHFGDWWWLYATSKRSIFVFVNYHSQRMIVIYSWKLPSSKMTYSL